VVLLSERVSPTEFGATWYYMQETLGYPVSVVETNNFNRLNLASYNTLILQMNYYDFLRHSRKDIRMD
jgi:hypothetical protein